MAATLGMTGLLVGAGGAIAQPSGSGNSPVGPLSLQRRDKAPLPSNIPRAALDNNAAVAAAYPPGTYSYWILPVPAPGGYFRLYQTVTPNNDPIAAQSQASPAYFYAMQWYNANNTTEGGYLGLQTDSQGKRVIFSWWGGINGRSPGTSGPFTGEGVGWQTVIPYNWQSGHSYRLTVNNSSNSSSGAWFTATILDVQSNRTSTIGSIEIPTSFGGLYPQINDFVEWYGPQQADCSSYPLSDTTFSVPKARDLINHPTVTSAPSNPPSATPNGPACSAVTNHGTSMQHLNGTL